MKGGKREGAGRPKVDELKKVYSVRFYPSDVEKIKAKYGSLQKWLNSLMRDSAT